MNDLDFGRKHDIADLQQARAGAKSIAEREMYEQIIHRIKTESAQISALRHKLILAMRAKDHPTVERIRNLIQMIKQNGTYGKSWGSDKGNKLLTK